MLECGWVVENTCWLLAEQSHNSRCNSSSRGYQACLCYPYTYTHTHKSLLKLNLLHQLILLEHENLYSKQNADDYFYLRKGHLAAWTWLIWQADSSSPLGVACVASPLAMLEWCISGFAIVLSFWEKYISCLSICSSAWWSEWHLSGVHQVYNSWVFGGGEGACLDRVSSCWPHSLCKFVFKGRL